MLAIEPQAVFHWFYQLNQIPRESGHEQAVSDFLVNFAKERGLAVIQDELWNVIIKKPASPGYEQASPVIIQGHMDMVCVKEATSTHDFRKDPIHMQVQDGFLTAQETSLGADDGIAVAIQLALLDGDYAHPPLECLITTQEETTMGGAAAVQGHQLTGKRLINIDAEEEGIFLTSCAGGATLRTAFPTEKTDVAQQGLRLVIQGLKGGHSGQEIIRQRANANICLFRILQAISQVTGLQLAQLSGGTKENAIPDRACADILVSDSQKAKAVIETTLNQLKAEYATEDPDLALEITEVSLTQVYSDQATQRLLDYFMLTPDGVQAMSPDIPGLVQTSLNQAVLTEEANQLILITSLRSAVQSQLSHLTQKLQTLAQKLGVTTVVENSYPAWQFQAESPLREHCLRVYEATFDRPASYSAIHAGLECGMLKKALPDCDMISYGPNLYDVHSTKERLDIASTARIWQFTCHLLAELKD